MKPWSRAGCPTSGKATRPTRVRSARSAGQEHLFAAATGDWELKPGHALPPLAKESGFIVARKEESMPIVKPKFELGQDRRHARCLGGVGGSGQSPGFFLERHSAGDWGEVCEEDKQANDEALQAASGSCRRTGRSRGCESGSSPRRRTTTANGPPATFLSPSEY